MSDLISINEINFEDDIDINFRKYRNKNISNNFYRYAKIITVCFNK